MLRCLLLLLTLTPCAADDLKADDEFQSFVNRTVTIRCPIRRKGATVDWFDPYGIQISPSNSWKFKINEDNLTLVFVDHPQDSGRYVCVSTIGNSKQAGVAALNLNGPIYPNAFEDRMPNLIAATLVSGGFATLSVILCLLLNWKQSRDEEHERIMNTARADGAAHANYGYLDDTPSASAVDQQPRAAADLKQRTQPASQVSSVPMKTIVPQQSPTAEPTKMPEAHF